MTTAMTRTASIEMPESGATREPTHSPSSGAPVQMFSVATPIAATIPTRWRRALTGASLAQGESRAAHLRAFVVPAPPSLTHLEYFSSFLLFAAEPEPAEEREPDEEPEEPAPPRAQRPPRPP